VRSLNRLCGPLLVVRAAVWAAEDFDARFSATWRRYRYSVLNRTADPFLAATAWHVERALDLEAMQAACAPLIGEHDFSTFCKRPKTAEPVSLVREILAADWTDLGDGVLQFEIRGSAFCHNMVRSIVGTLVEIGLGRIARDAMPEILAARDRGRSGKVAPPHGLCFWEVGYDGPRRHRPTGVPVALAARLPGVVPAT
jgi:tRNA pseudouridine38-40 synthase